ncbi:hypothetical protein F3C99_11135 [Vitellibacter sp. q18]|nr:hypothetical protein [Aequorivita lutea]
MKLTPKIAGILLRLEQGETIPASAAKSKIIDELVSENIIYQKGKHRKTLTLINAQGLSLFLSNQLQIQDLEVYVAAIEDSGSSRADFVKVATDSKTSKERAFKGFLVNAYQPINATLNATEYLISPQDGNFHFIYDYENFRVPEDVTIVGVENARNFRHIHEQRYLFEDIRPLFISRYPQSQHKDVISWLKSIPNQYLHFGDFDLAGIAIYLQEYKRHLGGKATFFVPPTLEKDLNEKGNRRRYNIQKINFELEDIQELKIVALIKQIHSVRKGLDQEFYIKSNL